MCIRDRLQRDSLEIARCRLDDELADLGRAGEGDLVHIGMFCKRGAGRLSITGDDVHYTVGETGLGDEFAQADRRERSLLCRLQHDGASRRQSGRQLQMCIRDRVY